MTKILIVGHDPDLLDLLTTILEEQGYAVDSVLGDDQALAWPGQAAPAALLLHPGGRPGNCRSLVATCRQAAAPAQLPILVLIDPGQAAEVEDLAVDAVVVVPFDLDVLLGQIARLVAVGSAVSRSDGGPQG